MAAGTITQGLQVTVTSVTGNSSDATTRQNVKKRIADILYLEQPPDDAVRLAYVASKESIPENILFIGDRSDSLHANSRPSATREFTGTRGPVAVENKNFLVTQIFRETTSESLPLYYKHVLPSTVDPGSVRIFDKNLVEVSSDKYLVEMQYEHNETTGAATDEESECHVYNSLKSWFDTTTGEYEIFFIQYLDGTDTVSTLLDNENAYTEAGFDDIWSVSLGPKPWLRVYLLSEDLVLRLPAVGKYSVKYIDDERIRVKPPSTIDNISPWFPRITNGRFSGGIGTTKQIYKIPEFSNQAFNPLEPYKRAAKATCKKVTDGLIKFPHEEIVTGDSLYPIDITIELDGVLQYAITTDTSKIGTVYRDIDGSVVEDSDGDNITWSSTALVGVDGFSGFAAIDIDLKDSWDYFAVYTYKETCYEMSGLNMNPLFDTTAHTQTRAIYLVPETGYNQNQGAQTAAIQWVKVSPAGVIEATSQDGSGSNPDIADDVQLAQAGGYGLSGIIGMHYGWRAETATNQAKTLTPGGTLPVSSTSFFPRSGWLRVKDTNGYWRYMEFTDKSDTSLRLGTSVPSVVVVPDESEVELVNFVDEYTTETTRSLADEETSYGVSGGQPSIYAGYFLLANLSINPPHGPQEATVIDVREDGGGLIPSLYEDAKKLNAQAQWLNDVSMYDGQPHPGDATIVVKLPESLKEQFSEAEIEEIVEENIPFGTKPLIRYYGYQPQIMAAGIMPQHPLFYFIDAGCSMFTILWEKMGSEFTYDVWIATDLKGPWYKVNRTRLIDRDLDYTYFGDYNYYTIYSVEESRKYCVKVTCYDKYDLWWYSYSDYDSISGGGGASGDAPSPPFGNAVGLAVTIT